MQSSRVEGVVAEKWVAPVCVAEEWVGAMQQAP